MIRSGALLAMLLVPAGWALVAGAPCFPVDGERILGRDLAGAAPAFAALDPEASLGHAPVPGARRVFTVGELARLAARFGIDAAPSEPVCFETPARVLGAADLEPVLLAALGIPEADIEIADISRFPAPEGLIVFPRASLANPIAGRAEEPVLWKGYVQYGKHSRFPVWARVRILAPVERLVALVPLAPGDPIQPGQVTIEQTRGFPAPAPALSLEEIAAMTPRNPIPAGSPIDPRQLKPSILVRRGSSVTVEARAGGARLLFEAEAETDAGLGQFVRLRNASSGKTFTARVSAPGRAVVDADPAPALSAHR